MLVALYYWNLTINLIYDIIIIILTLYLGLYIFFFKSDNNRAQFMWKMYLNLHKNIIKH